MAATHAGRNTNEQVGNTRCTVARQWSRRCHNEKKGTGIERQMRGSAALPRLLAHLLSVAHPHPLPFK